MRAGPGSQPSISRRVLLAALVGLLLGAGLLCARLASIRSQIWANFFRVDPATGYIVDQMPGDQRVLAMARLAQRNGDTVLVWTLFAVACVTVIMVALWHMDRGEQLGLPRIAAPIVAVLGLGLGFGVLNHLHFQDELIRVHELVFGVPLESTPESCIPRLRVCSRIVAFESARTLFLAMFGLVGLLGLAPAGIAAWRAGVRGHRLDKFWSWAAILCFAIGLVALVLTRGHRRDRTRAGAACDPSAEPWAVRAEPWPNSTSEELVAVPVQRCTPELWPAQRERKRRQRFELIAGYQLFVDGELALLPQFGTGWDAVGMTAAQLGDQLRDGIVQRTELSREDRVTIVALYGDERLTTAHLTEHLRVMRDAGVNEVLLLGAATVEGQLETVGAWTRRVHCPVGRVKIDDTGVPIASFESLAELSAAASSEGYEGLRVALDGPVNPNGLH